MGKDKKDMLCLLFVPLAIFVAVWAGKIPVTEFYQGAKCGVHIQYHASFFLMFFARVLYTFGDFEQYFQGYGVIAVVRHRKRERLFYHSMRTLIQKTVIFHLFVLVCAIVISILIFPYIDLSDGTMWRGVVLYVSCDFFMALLQMLVEIRWDGRVGICVAGVYDMLSILISDVLWVRPYGKGILWMFLPNLGVKSRVEACGYSSEFIFLALLSAAVLAVLAGRYIVKRKDVL